MILLPGLGHAQTRVMIPEPGGLALRADLFLPARATAPGVVALHGCAGIWPRRDFAWARLLAGQGHAVLLPDSFGSRGAGSQCKAAAHAVSAYTARKADALAAAAWLQAQDFAPPGGVFLLGWSDGGTTVLAALGAAPPAMFRGAVAFYPACARLAKTPGWRPAARLLILMGAADDWTPAAPCQLLAARSRNVSLKLFPGAYHDFDVPDDPVHVITGLPYTLNGGGTVHAGTNPAARAAALSLVPTFLRAP